MGCGSIPCLDAVLFQVAKDGSRSTTHLERNPACGETLLHVEVEEESFSQTRTPRTNGTERDIVLSESLDYCRLATTAEPGQSTSTQPFHHILLAKPTRIHSERAGII